MKALIFQSFQGRIRNKHLLAVFYYNYFNCARWDINKFLRNVSDEYCRAK